MKITLNSYVLSGGERTNEAITRFEAPSDKKTTLLEDATLCTIQTHSKGNASYTLYKIYGGNLHETK